MTGGAPDACRPLEAEDYSRVAHPAVFEELAAKGPVHRAVLPGEAPVWLITSRPVAEAALRDRRLSKDPLPAARHGQVVGRRRVPEDFTAVSGRQLMNLDGPDHTRIRRVLGRHLSDPALAVRQPVIDEVVEKRLAVLAEADTADLVADFATPLVTEVTGQLLGIPPDLNEIIMGYGDRLFGPEDPATPAMSEAYQRVVDAAEAAWKRREEEPERDDLLGALVRARRDGVLSRRELTSNLAMVLIGAGGALVRMLTYGAAVLERDEHTRTELLSGNSFAVVERLISGQPPIPFTSWRFATEPIELAGCSIAAGEAVLVLIAAANRDTGCPGPARPGHLSFGGGAHGCPGAPLARRTAATALTALFRRFPAMRSEIPIEEFGWRGGIGPRGPVRVPVRLTRPVS